MLTHALGTNSLYVPDKRGEDDAESSIPSPLGTIHASWYSTAMTSQHNAIPSVLGENVYHGKRSLIGITQADRLESVTK